VAEPVPGNPLRSPYEPDGKEVGMYIGIGGLLIIIILLLILL
jgi:hypothetical protein